ncbi:Nop52-domain-containing protein [Hysterangium stoloniferum]|nr:Nop52-domain-containing protein [Hysterangium stoloniferum]
MESSSSTPPLGKYLASSDKKTRDKAVKNLSVFLSNNSKEPLPKPELAKLWKGIFYCYWMSDKPLVQQALSSELAELVLTISTASASLAFLRAFWEATVREWGGIDRLRLDKYYMLIRKFTNAAFRLLIREQWASGVCTEYNDILRTVGGPLCPEDNRVPNSLGYHLSDIYLEELNKAVKISSPCPPTPLCTMFAPFLALAARTPSNVTYKRLHTSLFEPLLSNLAIASESSTQDLSDDLEGPKRKRTKRPDPIFQDLIYNSRRDENEPKAQTPNELRKSIYQAIFDVASQQETRDSNRRKLYAVWKEGIEDDFKNADVDGS